MLVCPTCHVCTDWPRMMNGPSLAELSQLTRYRPFRLSPECPEYWLRLLTECLEYWLRLMTERAESTESAPWRLERTSGMPGRDHEFGIQIGSDWPQMEQIWDFLRSVSEHFGAARQNVLKLILISHKFAPFRSHLTYFGSLSDILVFYSVNS